MITRNIGQSRLTELLGWHHEGKALTDPEPAEVGNLPPSPKQLAEHCLEGNRDGRCGGMDMCASNVLSKGRAAPVLARLRYPERLTEAASWRVPLDCRVSLHFG